MRRHLAWAFAAASAVLCAGAATAGETIGYGPPPAWVKVATLEPAAPSADAGAWRMVMLDSQSRHGPDGDELYTDRAIQVLSRQALEAAGMIAQVWNPSNQDLTIHTLQIIRDGQVIDALAQGDKFVALRQETNLSRAVLDGRLTASKQLEDLRVGDIVRVSATLRYHDPMLDGHSQGGFGLAGGPPIDQLRQRYIWPAGREMKWRVTEGFPAPTLTTTPEGSELVVEARNLKAPVLPVGAPTRYSLLGSLSLSDFAGWREVAALFAEEYAAAATLRPDSPLKAEAETIRAAHATPLDRAGAALHLVEDRVRYLALTMGSGGFRPADADQTWSRKFGDCKGKSALLVALLAELGIPAEVAMVNTENDGVNEMMPGLVFDHVIVRAEIDGKVYWMDPTRSGDKSLATLPVPPFNWALPIRAGGAELEALKPRVLTQPETETLVEVDATGGPDVDAPIRMRMTFRGDAAREALDRMNAGSRSESERLMREHWASETLVVDKVDFGEEDDGAAFFELTGAAKKVYVLGEDRRYYVVVSDSSISMDFPRRDPATLQPDAPYAVRFPGFERYVTRMRLPQNGDGFEIVGKTVDFNLSALSVRRTARIENGVLIVEQNERTLASEIPAMEARDAARRAEPTGITDNVFVRAPRRLRASASDRDSPSRTAEQQRREAEKLADKGDTDGALALLAQAVKIDPGPDSLLARAGLRSGRGEAKDWLADAQASLAKAPGYPAAMEEVARAATVLRDRDLALKTADDLVTRLPGWIEPLRIRATARLRGAVDKPEGDIEGAVADMRLAVQARGPDAATGLFDARVRLAQLLRRGHPEEAITLFQTLRAERPSDVSILGELCEARAMSPVKTAAGVADCEAAVAAAPDNTDYVDFLAFTLLQADRDAEAVAAFDRALLVRPSQARAQFGRAIAKGRLGDAAGALADASLALRTSTPAVQAVRLHGYEVDAATLAALKAAPPAQVPAGGTRTPPRTVRAPIRIDYPERAEGMEREGRVRLNCTVTVAGNLANCLMTEEQPMDMGFARAAEKVALTVRYEPGTLDGKPIETRNVVFAVPFRLD